MMSDDRDREIRIHVYTTDKDAKGRVLKEIVLQVDRPLIELTNVPLGQPVNVTVHHRVYQVTE